jgi:hypothetical protein
MQNLQQQQKNDMNVKQELFGKGNQWGNRWWGIPFEGLYMHEWNPGLDKKRGGR